MPLDLDENEPYQVQPQDGEYRVVDWEENVVLSCSDSLSAEQYAALLNRAFRRGYKLGVRKTRHA